MWEVYLWQVVMTGCGRVSSDDISQSGSCVNFWPRYQLCNEKAEKVIPFWNIWTHRCQSVTISQKEIEFDTHIQILLALLGLSVLKWRALAPKKVFKYQKTNVTEERCESDCGRNKLHRKWTYGPGCPAKRNRSIEKKAGKLGLGEG